MIVQHRFRVMKTDALLVVHPRGMREATVTQRLREAERRANDIERVFSRFMPDSELCHVNERAGEWTDISREMSEVLELAYGLHLQTGGLFDPSILPDLERAGYDRSFEALPAERPASVVESRGQRASFADIAFAPRRVRLPRGARIDLGGLVKGWASDTIADELADCGPCLVELGGDTAVRGVPPGAGGWEIGVGRGTEGRLIGVASMSAGGVATSGTETRRWRMGTSWAHHLIDPRTGEPSTSELVQVTAFAQNAAFAEVWAKTALIAGQDAATAMMRAHPEIQLILVPDRGVPLMSPKAPLVYGPPLVA